jgi:Xaa-Pro aminopeptidase
MLNMNLLERSKRVGFESHYVTYAQYRKLRRLFPEMRFFPTADMVEDIALVKDETEIAAIQHVVDISDRVFDDVVKILRPGVQEREVAAEISYLHKCFGATSDAFEPIIASGKRGALPHARASSKRVKAGELVTLDFGCCLGGYNSDITRTVAVGRVSRKARALYDIVLGAQREAISKAVPGMWAKDLDAVARQHIRRSGYGRFFTHSLGHGLGLHVHERPRISSLSKDRLQAGSVITIEPGLYLPDLGGVRIEDDVVLTPTGSRVMNSAPKELMVL